MFKGNSAACQSPLLLIGPLHFLVWTCVVFSTMRGISADDEQQGEKKSRTEVLASQRFELMLKRVSAAHVTSKTPDFPTRFESKPIFKYSDPARGYVAAAVWKLGSQGRPLALLATELDRSTYGRPVIAFEYGSLTSTQFTVTSEEIRWSPTKTLYAFKPIPNAPMPHLSSTRRLIQMRDIAKRFASREVVNQEKCELRMLSQPVDRYQPSESERSDGAIFFFTFGTNPEVVLLIESDGTDWSYAAGRMTGAQEVVLTLDGEIVWEGAPLEQGLHSPFTGNITAVDIPGIAADGSAVPE